MTFIRGYQGHSKSKADIIRTVPTKACCEACPAFNRSVQTVQIDGRPVNLCERCSAVLDDVHKHQ
jgi:hypothetical protein